MSRMGNGSGLLPQVFESFISLTQWMSLFASVDQRRCPFGILGVRMIENEYLCHRGDFIIGPTYTSESKPFGL